MNPRTNSSARARLFYRVRAIGSSTSAGPDLMGALPFERKSLPPFSARAPPNERWWWRRGKATRVRYFRGGKRAYTRVEKTILDGRRSLNRPSGKKTVAGGLLFTHGGGGGGSGDAIAFPEARRAFFSSPSSSKATPPATSAAKGKEEVLPPPPPQRVSRSIPSLSLSSLLFPRSLASLPSLSCRGRRKGASGARGRGQGPRCGRTGRRGSVRRQARERSHGLRKGKGEEQRPSPLPAAVALLRRRRRRRRRRRPRGGLNPLRTAAYCGGCSFLEGEKGNLPVENS